MNGTPPAPSRLPAAILLPGAAALAAFAQSLPLPWDPRSNVPVSPGSDTLTTGCTWWGTDLTPPLAGVARRLRLRSFPATPAPPGARC